jgi:hypothetical protein
MALITCKECQHKISSQAAACPSCGAPIARAPKRTSPLRIVVVVIAVIAVIGVIAAIISSPNNSSTTPPDKNPVKTRAALDGSAVLITNLNDYEWPSVTVYLNGNPLDGYSAGPYGPVLPNRDLRIPFTKFVRGDLRFNIYERKVNQVIVSVDGHDAPVFSFK